MNVGYAQAMYERFVSDPASVDDDWRRAFQNGNLAAAAGVDTAQNGQGPAAMPAAAQPTPTAPAAAAPSASPTAAPSAPTGATPIRGPAARLVANMTASLAIPTATSFREIEVASLAARRAELNAALKPKKVSFTHLIGYAIVQAASVERSMSHAYTEIDGQPHRVDPGSVNLGLAVDVERKDGSRFLVVPVIKQAEGMDFAAFHAAYEALVERARNNRLSPDDLQGATITLTNPGTIGTTASVPRLMAGQGTIVATGAIREVGGAKLMTLTSTYDHRIIQGAESGSFLRRIDELLRGGDGFYESTFGSLGLQPGPLELRSPERDTGADAPAAATAAAPTAGTASLDDLKHVAAAVELVEALRSYGYLGARLDPLGSDPPGDPSLDPVTHGLTDEVMARIPADVLDVNLPGATLAELLPELRSTYCGTIAYEVEHIASHEERAWLRRVIESGEHRRPLSPEEKKRLLQQLTDVEAFERFLHRAYLGQKRFSIEGLDAMVPMLDLVVEMAGEQRAENVVIGMAHRGRLDVLSEIVDLPYGSLMAEFEVGRRDEQVPVPDGGVDDVKYHIGAEGKRETASGNTVRVTLSPNPSHLEAVDPVVEGGARAQQTDRSGAVARHDPSVTVPVLIHGDAAFTGQGVVAETFNLERLAGYTTGGTIHIISNNQLGFTTRPSEARSTRYASDMAKGFDIPIIHVNADDAEACLAAARLAIDYRATFHGDVVIDLVGYRRYGHNEGDEPAYTQPTMYETIRRHPTVREQYRQRLVEEGVVEAKAADAQLKAAQRRLAEIQASVREKLAGKVREPQLQPSLPVPEAPEPETAVAADLLQRLNEQLHSWPEGFNVHPKLLPQIVRRREALAPDGKIEWGQAESLAFATLLVEGIPVRLTGQDTVRGTFSQRHQTLFDAKTAQRYTPIHHLDGARASFELHNSPLSEFACLGFEYGYAATAPEALVLWEAQFGDFVNGGQVIVDQFIIAGLAKWGQTSRLTLLLPHGYEGQGPEHSSARLERFLALGAEGNIRVAYCSTAAQYFHLLRRQALDEKVRPLVAMTPKSLLRLPEASATVDELSNGRFEPVIDDPSVDSADRAAEIRRLLLCSGKVYYDLTLSELRAAASDAAIGRVELLYPLPSAELKELIGRYPNLREVVWVQEEPRNMGARKFVLPKLRDVVAESVPIRDVSRPDRSRPAEGYTAAHTAEQARIVRDALG